MTASGLATAAARSARIVPSSAKVRRSSGNTSSPSVRNIPSWAIHASPSWNVAIVRRAGVRAVPRIRPAT
jgi:hypothetical protein